MPTILFLPPKKSRSESRTSDVVSIHNFGVFFLGKLATYLDRGFAADAFRELKANDLLSSMIAQKSPHIPIVKFGKHESWEDRIKAVSYILYGTFLSEEELIKRLEAKQDEDLRVLSLSSFVFETIAQEIVFGVQLDAKDIIQALSEFKDVFWKRSRI